MDFGRAIRKLRTKGKTKMSLRELSESTGMSLSYLSNIERGSVPPPTAEKIKLISEILNGDTNELLRLANRIDEDNLEEIRDNPKLKRGMGEKAIKFLTSAMNLEDGDSLGGITGIFEIVTGEGFLNPEFKLGRSGFKTVNFLVQLYAESDDSVEDRVEIRREIGQAVLELMGNSPYSGTISEEKEAFKNTFIEIFKKYPKELCEEVIKNEQLKELYLQSLPEEREEESS